MQINAQILLKLTFKTNKDYNNYNTDISESLNDFPPILKKRITICSIELIQNNIIHNSDPNLTFEIKKDENFILIETTQTTNQKQMLEIIEIINYINSKSLEELKTIYISNIKSETYSEKNHGNGLIICKLKSNNNIEFNIIQNELSIKLKFEII